MRTDGALVKIAQVSGIHSLIDSGRLAKRDWRQAVLAACPDVREIAAWIRGSTRPSRTDRRVKGLRAVHRGGRAPS